MLLGSLSVHAPIVATEPTPVPVDSGTGGACPQCGVNSNSGKRSCCVRGGTWFKKCGDPGDSNFEHTWDEGMKACKGKLSGCQFDIYGLISAFCEFH